MKYKEKEKRIMRKIGCFYIRYPTEIYFRFLWRYWNVTKILNLYNKIEKW